MLRNSPNQTVGFQAISRATGNDVTVGAPVVYVTKDGQVQTAGLGTSIHEGNGAWTYIPTQAETNADHVLFTFTMDGVITQTVNVYPIRDLTNVLLAGVQYRFTNNGGGAGYDLVTITEE